MDEWTADTFIANRDDPIPTINIQGNNRVSSDGKHRSDAAKDQASHRDTGSEGVAVEATAKHSKSHSIQDRLFAKLLEQVIPTDTSGGGGAAYDDPASKYLNRPGFSLPVMTNNFRRFNARIGVVFVFQARAIRLFTWRRYSHTLSFLAIYSFMCLYPYLIAILPCCLLLFFIFVPAYLARHPPPPAPSLSSAQYALSGPPIAPARVIKPATEMSRDFFHNMRDLQNVMDDFSVLHDLALDTITPLTNFSREALSSTLFMLLTCLTCALFLVSPHLPWRHICLVAGWALVSLGHPAVQALAQNTYKSSVHTSMRGASSRLEQWSAADIALDEDAEVLEVEIFELQRRRGGFAGLSTTSNFSDEEAGYDTEASSGASAAEWEGWMFSPSAWEPQAPPRIAGERPKGTRFFEDVVAPEGWEWGGKKWVLDLGSQEWVEDRMLGGLEVEVEGERWVYDMSEAQRASKARREGKKSKGSVGSVVSVDAGESRGQGRGEWRRRRWVRLVRRKKVLVGGGTRVLGTGGK